MNAGKPLVVHGEAVPAQEDEKRRYPRAPEGEQAWFPLHDVDAALDLLAGAIAIARTNVENGLALPGIDAGDGYDGFAFALPANASYLPRKSPFADRRMSDATKIWEAD
jgi:hypothetical protein